MVPVAAADAEKTAREAIIGFFKTYGMKGEADQVQKDFEAKRVKFGPVPDGDNADTDVVKKVVTIKADMVHQIVKADGTVDFYALANAASTLRHEHIHVAQDLTDVIASNARWFIGRGRPHEVSAWGAALQSLYDWAHSELEPFRSTNEAQREAAASRIRDLVAVFKHTLNDYVTAYGGLALVDREGVPLSMRDALAEMERMDASAKVVLERAGFAVKALPPVQFPRRGERFRVEAGVKGSAPGGLTYRWLSGGTPLGVTTASITRTATGDERLTVEVQDSLGRKRSADCVVTVQRPAPAPVSTPAPRPKPAPPLPIPVPTAAGAWVLKGTRPLGQVGADSACYPRHTLSLGAGSATGTCQYGNCGNNPAWGKEKSGSATGLITWNAFPQTLRPGERFTLNLNLSLKHTLVPLGLPCSCYVYFNSQASLGGGSIGHSGDNPGAKDSAPVKVELPPMPSGRPGQTFTIWINVATPGGIGDCFYDYEFR
jgi:hypothetical protein